MAWQNDGRVFVVVHTSAAPDRSEWQGYVRALQRTSGGPDRRVLVRTYGGSPDGAQRKMLTDVAQQHETPAAILTNTVLARAVATAISWFIPKLKVFGIHGLVAAYDFLELTPAERTRAHQLLTELESELGIQAVRSQPDEAASSE
jgi:hypothetical protein